MATLLTGFLIFGKFDRSLSEFELSRYSFLLEDMQAIFVRDLDIGLGLDQIGNAESLLARHISSAQGVTALALFDARGHVLARVGSWRFSELPVAWVALNNGGGSRPWMAAADDVLVAGMRLSNDFGITVGGVVLEYSRAEHQALLSGMAHKLTLAATVISIGVVVLSFLLSSLLIARTRKALKCLEDELKVDKAGPILDDESITQRFRSATAAALEDIHAAQAEILGMSEKGNPDAGRLLH